MAKAKRASEMFRLCGDGAFDDDAAVAVDLEVNLLRYPQSPRNHDDADAVVVVVEGVTRRRDDEEEDAKATRRNVEKMRRNKIGSKSASSKTKMRKRRRRRDRRRRECGFGVPEMMQSSECDDDGHSPPQPQRQPRRPCRRKEDPVISKETVERADLHGKEMKAREYHEWNQAGDTTKKSSLAGKQGL